MLMQETIYRDKDGGLNKITEMFNLPSDESQHESAMRRRYEAALKRVFGEGGELLSIRQGKIGRNDTCPCGSGRKFKRCCEAKLNVALATNGH